jgi:hypothetical protein
LEWSKSRSTVYRADLIKLFQDIRDSYSRAPINEALKNQWISVINFNSVKNSLDDYYDGQAARPAHIGLGLPVRRKGWEKEINESLTYGDVTTVRASSGQGKSTLAWLVTYQMSHEWSIYQLHTCRDVNEANAHVEFLQSRLSVGEKPIVVIDGLNFMTKDWAILVEKTQELDIKYLITAREEDWYRHGADISRVQVKIIDVSLSNIEAREIYEQLKKKGKLHDGVNNWQPVWEQVHSTGLLIEYTYLLTKGQMLHDRLKSQIKTLNDSRSSGAKLEMLRMITLADCLDIKIGTYNLINYIKSSIGFEQDRGELLNELKKEYYIDFDGNYVIGLHPIRSQHLKVLLHESLPITESLVNLYTIIDEDQKQTFFVNTLKQLDSEGSKHFYKAIAKQLANENFIDMVFALDGIMYSQPQLYWLRHKDIFDTAFETGGGELFTSSTIPFSSGSSLDELANILGEKASNLGLLARLQKQLPKFEFKDTEMAQLARELQTHLGKRTAPIVSYMGLEWLAKWFNLLQVPFYCPTLKDKVNIDELIDMNINEAREFMQYFQISDPEAYEKFTLENKASLISFLKRETNTLTIEEKGNELHLEYLLFDHEVANANEASVFRLQNAAALLPSYVTYHAEGVMLPFPSEYIISAAKNNATKHLTKEAIGDLFKIHINIIWVSSIEKNYQTDSAYHWQKDRIEFRNTALQWAKEICRFIDSLLEGNQGKRKTAFASLITLQDTMAKSRKSLRAYPKFRQKYPDVSDIKSYESKIDNWLFPLNNFNTQLNNIFQPKTDHDRHVAIINLKDIIEKLEAMQLAFQEVEKQTIAYFNSRDIYREEVATYRRLYITIAYYLSQLPLETKMAVKVAKKAAEEWWTSTEGSKLKLLKQTLENIAVQTKHEFVYPNDIELDSKLTYISFGVRNLDFTNEVSFTELLFDLAPLAALKFDFCTILAVKEHRAIVGLRFQKDYFEAFNAYLEGDGEIEPPSSSPLPVTIDETILRFYPELTVPEVDQTMVWKEKLIRALYAVWKLSEVRRRLDPNSVIERGWLDKMETQYLAEIGENMIGITNIKPITGKFIEDAMKSKNGMASEDIVKQLFNIVND